MTEQETSISRNKIKISFELDLSDFPAYSIPEKEVVPAALQNIGSWLSQLRIHYLEQSFYWCRDEDETSALMVALFQDKADLCQQIFNNYRIEGCTSDGVSFVFTHKEPGYEESLVYSDESE